MIILEAIIIKKISPRIEPVTGSWVKAELVPVEAGTSLPVVNVNE